MKHNFKNKLLILMVISTLTTSILPLTFFDNGSIVHRGGPGDSRHHDHFWNKHKNDSDDNNKAKEHERAEIKRKISAHKDEIDNHKKELKNLNKNKNLDSETRKKRIKKHEDLITELEEEIKYLEKRMDRLF